MAGSIEDQREALKPPFKMEGPITLVCADKETGAFIWVDSQRAIDHNHEDLQSLCKQILDNARKGVEKAQLEEHGRNSKPSYAAEDLVIVVCHGGTVAQSKWRNEARQCAKVYRDLRHQNVHKTIPDHGMTLSFSWHVFHPMNWTIQGLYEPNIEDALKSLLVTSGLLLERLEKPAEVNEKPELDLQESGEGWYNWPHMSALGWEAD